MSVDREDRARVSDAIDKYLRCEIDNSELDDVLFSAKDRAAFEIATQVWFFYDDVDRHKNEEHHKISEAGEAMLRRWIRFLRSEREWPLNEPDSRTAKWYCPGRWRGILTPIGYVCALILLPIMLFKVIVLRHPRPRYAKNKYWPFQSAEEWADLTEKGWE